MVMEGLFQILKDGTSSHHTIFQMVNTEAFHRLHMEMAQQFLLCSLFGKHPVFHFKGTKPHTEVAFKFSFAVVVIEHLLRLEVGHEFLHIVGSALTSKEFAR